MNLIVDTQKALKKWSPVLEHLNVKDVEKREWIAEYAEMHQVNKNVMMTENVAYSQLGNSNGMGAVTAPTLGAVPGQTWGTGSGNVGSGDVAQNLLPVSMKIAAQAIGLDLVAVKPAASTRIEMMFVDFKYDNSSEDARFGDKDERPMVFKIKADTNDKQSELETYLKLHASAMKSTELIGGYDKRMWVTIGNGVTVVPVTAPTGSKENILEFLGFSRVDGYPMFHAYRQYNTAASGTWIFDQTKNTFPATTDSVATIIGTSGLTFYSGDTSTTGHTSASTETCSIQLVSTMEDNELTFFTSTRSYFGSIEIFTSLLIPACL